LSSSSKARWHLAQKSSDFSQVTACGVPKCTSVLIGKPRTRNARFSRVSGSHCSSEDVGFAQRAKPGIVMSGRHPLIKGCFNAPACETKQCSASRRRPANTGALGLRCAKEHRAAIVNARMVGLLGSGTRCGTAAQLSPCEERWTGAATGVILPLHPCRARCRARRRC
jgi:hypothetical protein